MPTSFSTQSSCLFDLTTLVLVRKASPAVGDLTAIPTIGWLTAHPEPFTTTDMLDLGFFDRKLLEDRRRALAIGPRFKVYNLKHIGSRQTASQQLFGQF